MLYQMCQFGNPVIRNDVMTKNNGKIRTSAKPSKLYLVRKVLIRAIQKCTFLLNLNHDLTMTTHQIWPSHVIQAANFEKFLFWSDFTLNFGKITKCVENKLKNKKVTGKKQKSGWKTSPPVLVGLRSQKLI